MLGKKLKCFMSGLDSPQSTGPTLSMSAAVDIEPKEIPPVTILPCVSLSTGGRQMKLDDLDILKSLGSGASGVVYLVKDKVTSEHLALKIIKQEGCSAETVAAAVIEQKVQCAISGAEHFLPLEASWHDGVNFYLAMKYCPAGDLAFELMRCRTFDAPRARFYAAELVMALEALHKQNIIHRDVKPGNILFTDSGHVMLSDFGTARLFDVTNDIASGGLVSEPSWVSFDVDGDSDSGSFLQAVSQPAFLTEKHCGTPYYMSPEMHYGEKYSFEVDFWSLGVTLYRMLTGRMPFGTDAVDRNEIAAHISEDPLVFQADDDVDSVTQDFLQGLLDKRCHERLTLAEIKDHPYFEGINWEKVAQHQVPAPWMPFIPSFPKKVRTDIEIAQGPGFNETNEDGYPEFAFTSKRLQSAAPAAAGKGADQISLGPVAATLRRIFGRLFTKTNKSPKLLNPPPEARVRVGGVAFPHGNKEPVTSSTGSSKTLANSSRTTTPSPTLGDSQTVMVSESFDGLSLWKRASRWPKKMLPGLNMGAGKRVQLAK